MLNGLLVVNVELTSRCNKSCWMCGRRKIDRDHPEISQDYGDMDFDLACSISKMLPDNTIVQFHNNGEPTLYPRLGDILQVYRNKIRCFNTNAKLLVSKAYDIIDNMESLTVSVVQDDTETDAQYETVKKFIAIRGDRKPFLVYRLLGEVKSADRWRELPGVVATRTLHNPLGSFGYKKKVTMPEHGICLDLMGHLVIDRFGNVFPCVRFNPDRHNLLGNIRFQSLDEMWNGEIRGKLISEHSNGNRACSELCKKCEFYGCPTS